MLIKLNNLRYAQFMFFVEKVKKKLGQQVELSGTRIHQMKYNVTIELSPCDADQLLDIN